MIEEPVGIAVNARDRFSPTSRHLRTVFATTPGAGELHPIHCVVGGAPQHLRDAWSEEFDGRVTFTFLDRFVNQAESRNIAMRQLDTRLVAVSDNDTYPRSGWLEALYRCIEETGAVMAVPLILEQPDVIHCAGNDLYIDERDGRRLGHKVLRLAKYPYHDGSNLERSEIPYGELHLMLVAREPTLQLNAFDEEIREVGEVDSGLAWSAGGHRMFFEPDAVTHFDLHGPLTADDVAFYAWRWDHEGVLAGYRHFEKKWGFDITEDGLFETFMVVYNSRVGRLVRRYPHPLTLRMSTGARDAADWLVNIPIRARNKARSVAFGDRDFGIIPVGVADDRS